jgi:hypothetical protein
MHSEFVLCSSSDGSGQGRLAEHLIRMDFVFPDELGYLPFAQAGGPLLFHPISRLDCVVELILVKLTECGKQKIELARFAC